MCKTFLSAFAFAFFVCQFDLLPGPERCNREMANASVCVAGVIFPDCHELPGSRKSDLYFVDSCHGRTSLPRTDEKSMRGGI